MSVGRVGIEAECCPNRRQKGNIFEAARCSVLGRGGAGVRLNFLLHPCRCRSFVDGEDFIAEVKTLHIEGGVARTDYKETIVDEAGAQGETIQVEFFVRGVDVGMAVL